MYSNYPNMVSNYSNQQPYYGDDERFFWAPFVVGGLAGTALGYGLANNNQMNNQPIAYYFPNYPVYPSYPVYPTYSSNTNYYY